MKKFVITYGTRPELIKLVPLIYELRKLSSITTIVVNTGQHIDMLKPLENFFEITPDFELNVMQPNQTINKTLSAVLIKIEELFLQIKPDLVFIQGDTSTVLATGMACFNMGIPVAHVEAGLRSFDLTQPFPEEFNRKVVSLFAKYNFAPTELSKNNLIAEKIVEEKIFITGNTVIDTIQIIAEKMQLSKHINPNKILITAHRRENHGEGMLNICKAIKEIIKLKNDVEFIWPVHSNPNVKVVVEQELKDLKQVQLLSPLDYFDLLQHMANSKIIWTDSGGIQEESPYFKKPVLILRNVTERPEVVSSGFGVLVGTNVEKIVTETTKLFTDINYYTDLTKGKNPFGDGNAAKKIIEIVTC